MFKNKMNSQNSFYMTLPSDVCMDNYPQNTPANWKTKLRRGVQLSGLWEVAVVEIIYPNSMFNVPIEQSIIVGQIVNMQTTDDLQKPTPAVCNTIIKIPAGIYSKEDLVTYIQDRVPELETYADKQVYNEKAKFIRRKLSTFVTYWGSAKI